MQMLIMSAGLVVAHRVEQTYSTDILYGARLNAYQRAVAGLRVLADNAAPPSVDIVQSDWEQEWSRIQYASKLFNRNAEQLAAQTELTAGCTGCNTYLQSLTDEMEQMVEQVREAGEALQSRDKLLFRTHLLYADRRVTRVHTALGNLGEEISRVKDDALAHDRELARRSRNVLSFLSTLGLLLVIPATAYARHLSNEIRAFEAGLQAEHDALEQRVIERTAALRAEVEERRKIEQFDRGRNRVLEMVAEGASVQDVLSELADITEAYCTEGRVMLTAVDEVLEAPIAPRLTRYTLSILNSLAENGPHYIAQTENKIVLIADIERELAIKDPPMLFENKAMASWWSVPILGSDGKVLGTISMFTSEHRQPENQELEILLSAGRMAALAIDHARMQEELFRRAHHDSLTQLPNRRLCDERITQAIERAARHNRKIGMLCIDLDEFKQVNDVHGHEVGDHLLRTIAVRLQARLRATDTLSRMGGDEFLAVLDDIKAPEDLEKIAEAMRNAIAEPIVLGNVVLRATASIGGAMYPTDGITAKELKLHSDHAMYRAKQRGRNVFQMFSAELSEKLARRRELENYLRDALDNGGFELYYQPQFTLNRELIGLEALLRFRKPELKSISPAEFIPVAEQTRLILQMGNWVIREVCRQSQEWCSRGFAPIRISVNVSALELTQENFAAQVEEALRNSCLQAKYLQVEVTETAVMSNMDEATRQLRRLERLGVAVSVDDFGTGHSSLSYLHRLPIDSLKVDRSFVGQITHSEESAAIVRAIVAMANSLGMQVIAEGVETEDQLSAVARVGCQLIQGYLFSRPLNCEAVCAMLTVAQNAPRASAAPVMLPAVVELPA